MINTIEVHWDYEDELKRDITNEMLNASRLDDVRMYPYIILGDGRKYYLEIKNNSGMYGSEENSERFVLIKDYGKAHCPICETDVHGIGQIKYCFNCGQKLKWF